MTQADDVIKAMQDDPESYRYVAFRGVVIAGRVDDHVAIQSSTMTELKPLRRGTGRKKLGMRLYFHSLICRECDRPYLYPGYGNEADFCNDCQLTTERKR
jgi:hypothetical protein